MPQRLKGSIVARLAVFLQISYLRYPYTHILVKVKFVTFQNNLKCRNMLKYQKQITYLPFLLVTRATVIWRIWSVSFHRKQRNVRC